jgi:hypothetical protein
MEAARAAAMDLQGEAIRAAADLAGSMAVVDFVAAVSGVAAFPAAGLLVDTIPDTRLGSTLIRITRIWSPFVISSGLGGWSDTKPFADAFIAATETPRTLEQGL